MRRVDLSRNQVATVPAGAHVEVVGNINIDSTSPQYIPIKALQGNPSTIAATTAGVDALIDAEAGFVLVTSSNANFIVFLPAAENGKRLVLSTDNTGCELRSSVASDDLNSVTIGADQEAALAASTLYELLYNNGNWIMTGLDSDGAVATLVVPDAV